MRDPSFWDAVSDEAELRTKQMLQGVSAFQNSDYAHHYSAHKVVWRKGNAQLRDFAPELPVNAPVLFCIPSLINKATIFDLADRFSFVKFLRENGIRPLLLDWGEPSFRERHFSSADYVAKFALDALKFSARSYSGNMHVLGYCLGGIFATALAQLAEDFIDGLIVLATPWDYHSDDSFRVALEDGQRKELQQKLGAEDLVPKEWMEWVFHLMQPYRFQEKFSRFNSLSQEDQAHFIAMEYWVNDGVPLAPKVAIECLLDWPQDNVLQTHGWQVKGATIRPSTIRTPTLAIVPSNDTIVPSACALALARQIPDCQIIEPKAGHVSLMAGKRAPYMCWQPIVSWIESHITA